MYRNVFRKQAKNMFYDAHTHLNCEKLFPERQHYLDLFLQAGGKGLVNSGASEFYNAKGLEIAKSVKDVVKTIHVKTIHELSPQSSLLAKTTLGLHPLECVDNYITPENIEKKFQEMKSLYEGNEKHVVAIGETGIDIHFPNGPETLQLQKELFSLQAERAKEIWLPLVIHSRDNFSETIDILQNYKELTIHFHCRSYGPKEYAQLEKIFPNLFVGFCGNLTYKNAQNLRDTLQIIPLEKLLLETDAPYLAPQAVRGQVNHPAYVKYIYEFASQELNIPLEKLCDQIEKNFKKIYTPTLK
jgi:TatD DNase family protein